MNNWEIRKEGGILQARVWHATGALAKESEALWTAKQASQYLGKSLRHFYRYLEVRLLPSIGKFLGEWLFDREQVKRFKWAIRKAPPPLQPITLPSWMGPLFPEYDIRKMYPWTNSPIVITRCLNTASQRSWRWIFQRFPLPLIKAALRKHGKRLMSPRSYYFWTWLLHI